MSNSLQKIDRDCPIDMKGVNLVTDINRASDGCRGPNIRTTRTVHDMLIHTRKLFIQVIATYHSQCDRPNLS